MKDLQEKIKTESEFLKEHVKSSRISILPEVKQKWTAALRSGNYDQAKGVLHAVDFTDLDGERHTDGYCCLGVLCKVYDLEEKIIKVKPNGEENIHETNTAGCFSYEEIENTTVLPGTLAFKLNIDSYVQATLASLNDDGATFEQIANIIEECL